jgi:hypothetical protein
MDVDSDPKALRQNETGESVSTPSSRARRPCFGVGGARRPQLTRNESGRYDTYRRELI